VMESIRAVAAGSGWAAAGWEGEKGGGGVAKRISAHRSMARLEALFLLIPPWPAPAECCVESFGHLLAFLQPVRHLPMRSVKGDSFLSGGMLTVQAESCPPELKSQYFSHEVKAWMRRPNTLLLRFSGDFPYPGPDGLPLKNSDGSFFDVTSEEHFAIWADVLQEEANTYVQTYIGALTIAYPAALRCGANIWLVDGEPMFHAERLVSTASESTEFLVQSGLKLGEIDPERVIKWVFSQSGILDGYSDTPASRALNYFTRLFVRDFSRGRIIRSRMGIGRHRSTSR